MNYKNCLFVFASASLSFIQVAQSAPTSQTTSGSAETIGQMLGTLAGDFLKNKGLPNSQQDMAKELIDGALKALGEQHKTAETKLSESSSGKGTKSPPSERDSEREQLSAAVMDEEDKPSSGEYFDNRSGKKRSTEDDAEDQPLSTTEMGTSMPNEKDDGKSEDGGSENEKATPEKKSREGPEEAQKSEDPATFKQKIVATAVSTLLKSLGVDENSVTGKMAKATANKLAGL